MSNRPAFPKEKFVSPMKYYKKSVVTIPLITNRKHVFIIKTDMPMVNNRQIIL